jgi:polar amino acid transport system permease protein
MFYTWHFEVIRDFWVAFGRGSLMTLQLTFWAFLLSSALALGLCFLSISKRRALQLIGVSYVEVFRGLPALVVLVWVYFALPIITGVTLSGFHAAVLGLTLSQAAFSAEIFRAGIESIDKGQMEAARIVGMSYFLAMRRIILPQAVRRMVPPFVNSFAGLLKFTSLASVIAVTELLHASTNVIQHTFRPLEVYTFAALLYLVMILPVTWFSRYLEKVMTYA